MANKGDVGSHVRRFSMMHVIGAVAVIGVGAAVITYNALLDRGENVATAKKWAASGPPCPTLTAAEFAQKRYNAPKIFDYDGVKIGRVAGNVSCSDVKQSGGKGLFNDKVCAFTSPATITVATKSGTYYYVPGVGEGATVVIHGDTPQCLMGSKYTLSGD